MAKINIREWKEFRVGDLFDVVLSACDLQADKLSDGDFPLISSGKTNNGICKHVARDEVKEIFPGGSITVDMFGKAFYQPSTFAAVSHGRVNILIPKIEMNEAVGLFLSSVIESVTSKKYSFSMMCSKKMISNETIELPIMSNGSPDFEYMKTYMRDLEKTVSFSLIALQSVQEQEKKKIDVSSWGEFKLGDLFYINNGKKYPKNSRTAGPLPLISTSAFNNGISDYIEERDDNTYSKFITVAYSGSVGATFYHENKVFVGETVIALEPKFNINRHIGLFLVSVLHTVNKKYNYENKIKVLNYANEKVKLPITFNGEPDWEYMESHMREIEEKINQQNSIIKEFTNNV